MHATRLSHVIIFDLIALIIFSKQYKLQDTPSKFNLMLAYPPFYFHYFSSASVIKHPQCVFTLSVGDKVL
jgi:hypothetical protein